MNKGKLSEKLVENFLVKNGYEILDKNFRFSKMGEIDIVALKKNKIHCIEVKSGKFMLWEKITSKKFRNIKRTFQIWLKLHSFKYKDLDYEIDLAQVKIFKKKYKIKILHNITKN